MTDDPGGVENHDQGMATLVEFPQVMRADFFSAILIDAGFFVFRPDQDNYVVAAKTLDPDGDHPSSVRIVLGNPAGDLRLEFTWAGGPPHEVSIDGAAWSARSVSDALSPDRRFERMREIDANVAELRRRWADGIGDSTVADVVDLRSRSVTIMVDRMAAAAAAAVDESGEASPRYERTQLARYAQADEVEVVVSGDPRRNELSVAVAATGPAWPGTLVEVNVTDGPHGAETYLVAMIGNEASASGRILVAAQSDAPTTVEVVGLARSAGSLTADDAPAVRRTMDGIDAEALSFWKAVGRSRPVGDPIRSAVSEALA